MAASTSSQAHRHPTSATHTYNQEVLISNSCGLSTRIFSLLFTKEMSDVCLQVGACTFELHKLILSASSDVFKAMLTNSTWPEAHRQPVVLVEEPLCEAVFAKFIEYIYSGELYLSHSTVCPLLTLADKYNVVEMIPLCRSYMLNNLDAPISKSCVLQWLKISHLRNDAEMEAAIMAFIECNFGLVMQTSDFMAADLEVVDMLLASSRLAVYNESMLLYGTMMWLETFVDNGQPSGEDIRAAFHRLLRHVRWAMLTPDEMACLQDCSVMQQFVQRYKQYLPPQPVFPLCQLYYPDAGGSRLQDLALNFTSGTLCTHFTKKTCNKEPLKSQSTKSSVQSIEANNVHSGRQDMQGSIPSRGNGCLSRVYISDYWCTALTISDFLTFPQNGTQTFLFSTPGTNYSYSGHSLEWEVELCPKGVHFPPAVLIGLERDGNKLVEESYLNTVRLSVMSRSEQELPVKVEVNVLIQASSQVEPGRTFVERCVSRTCIFDSLYQRHNLDDIVPCERITDYLRPENSTPSLHWTSAMAFTLYIVIRPLPLAEVT